VRITRADGNGIKRWVSPGTTQNVHKLFMQNGLILIFEGKEYIR